MPKVNDELIDKLATLSKLEFNKDEKEHIKKDLQQIFGFVEQLNEIDVEGTEPLIYVNEDMNVLRDDTATIEITQDDGLSNAPQKDSDYFKVPKVLKK